MEQTVRRSGRQAKPSSKALEIDNIPASFRKTTSPKSSRRRPNTANQISSKLRGSNTIRRRLAEGEVNVLGRRVNLDMGRNATLYKVAREWFHDNPELFAKDDLMTDGTPSLKPTIPFKKPTARFLPEPAPERAVAFSKSGFENAMATSTTTPLPAEDLMREHLIHYRQLRDWHEAQYTKSKAAPYRQQIQNVIAAHQAYMQQLHAQQLAYSQQQQQQQLLALNATPQRR